MSTLVFSAFCGRAGSDLVHDVLEFLVCLIEPRFSASCVMTGSSDARALTLSSSTV